MFILAHKGANDGLLILLMLNGAQTSIIDGMGKELGTLSRLVAMVRHTLKTVEVELKKRKKKSEG